MKEIKIYQRFLCQGSDLILVEETRCYSTYLNWTNCVCRVRTILEK